MKLYLAGALFNEGEISQRLKEGRLLKERFGEKLSVFNPIEQPFNEDSGVMVELGLAIALKKRIIAINSDIRLKSANKYEIPSYAMNHYVLGGILEHGKLVYSFDEALKELEGLFCLSK